MIKAWKADFGGMSKADKNYTNWFQGSKEFH